MWRIKEEPSLWRRYAHDAFFAALLILVRVFPLVVWNAWHKMRRRASGKELTVTEAINAGQRVVAPRGCLTSRNIDEGVSAFRAALARDEDLLVDLSGVSHIDARFVGLFMMLEKALSLRGRKLRFAGAPWQVALLLRLHGYDTPSAVRCPHGLAKTGCPPPRQNNQCEYAEHGLDDFLEIKGILGYDAARAADRRR